MFARSALRAQGANVAAIALIPRNIGSGAPTSSSSPGRARDARPVFERSPDARGQAPPTAGHPATSFQGARDGAALASVVGVTDKPHDALFKAAFAEPEHAAALVRACSQLPCPRRSPGTR